MKVMVTGASGFIGSASAAALRRAGHDVVSLDRRPAATPAHHSHHYALDIADAAAVQEVFRRERPQAVLHLAAQISVPNSVQDPLADMHDNILGSLSVFEAARNTGVRRVVAASSAAVYGDDAVPPIPETAALAPKSPYGVAKVAVEQYLSGFYKDYFSYGIFRYGNVYGPQQSHESGAVIAKLVHDAIATGRVRVDGDGSQQRDFVHVDDIAMLNVAALQSDDNFILNVGTGRPVQVNDLVRLVAEAVGRDIEIDHAPTRPGDIHTSYYDAARVRQVLGWKPTISLDAGIRGIVAAYGEQRR